MTWTSKVPYPPFSFTAVELSSVTDQEWLDAVNTERHAEQMSKVTPESFEIIMDRLEKEWFELVRAYCVVFPFVFVFFVNGRE